MPRSVRDVLQTEVAEIGLRAEGLAYLIRNLRVEFDDEREDDAHAGIGLILGDLADRARRASGRLDSMHAPGGVTRGSSGGGA